MGTSDESEAPLAATTAYRTAPLPEAPPIAPQWGRAALLAAAWVVGSFVPIPLPGVDGDAAREFLREGGRGLGLLSQGMVLPLFGGALSTLVVVRAALAYFTHDGDPDRQRRWYRKGAVFYLMAAAAQGFAIALWLEGARTGDYLSLVPSPGWGVRLGVMAASTVSAALAWQLATAITRTRAAHGPMLLLLVSALVQSAQGWTSLGREIARDEAPIFAVARALVGCAPTVLLLVALWRWSPRAWPRRVVRGVEALTPLDLLPLPMVVSAKVVALLPLAGLSSPGLGLAADALAGGACAALLARWLRRGGARRASGALKAAIALPLMALGVVVGSMVVEAKGVPRHVVAELWPFRPSTVVVLRGLSPLPDDDAQKIVTRLRALHHRAEVIEATRDTVRLRVTPFEGEAYAAVASVLARGTLAFYRAADDQAPVSPDGGEALAGLSTRVVGREGTAIYEGPTEASLAPVMARSEGVPGAVTRIGCDDAREPGGRRRCYALRLEPTPAVTQRDVASARAMIEPIDNTPRVEVEFTPAGAAAFADVTRRSVRHLIAIVVDDRINSAPVVMQEITGGRASITMGGGGDLRAQMAEAQALAAALSSGALGGQWQVAQ